MGLRQETFYEKKEEIALDEWFVPIQKKQGEAQFSSVAQLCPTLRPHELQHARLPCASPTPGVYPNPCPLSR